MCSTIQERKALIKKQLKSKGYSDEGVAAVMGNIEVETGGTFDYTTKQINGPGYGLFQLEGAMKTKYDEYKKEKGVFDSAQNQINFMHATLTEEKYRKHIGFGNAEKVKGALMSNNLNDATQTFCLKWQRPGKPHLQRRTSSANSIYYENKNEIKQSNSSQSYNYNSLGSTNSYSSPSISGSSSSGWGLSHDNSNFGYTSNSGVRTGVGYSNGPQISVSIPCEIM